MFDRASRTSLLVVAVLATILVVSCSDSGAPVAPFQVAATAPAATPAPVPTASPCQAPPLDPSTVPCLTTAFTPGPAVSPYAVTSSKNVYAATTLGLVAISEPLSPASTQKVVIASTQSYGFNESNVGGVAVDSSGRLAVIDLDTGATSSAMIYPPGPIAAGSAPLFSFPVNWYDSSPKFDRSGDLLTSDIFTCGCVSIYAPPFSSGTLAVHEIPGTQSTDSVYVSGSRYYVLSSGNVENVYDPPYVSPSSSFPLLNIPSGGLAESQIVDPAGNLIVGVGPAQPILVYPAPFGAMTQPVLVPLPEAPGNAAPEVIAFMFDNAGHLVVGATYCTADCNPGGGSYLGELLVYALPLTSRSVPSTIVQLSAGLTASIAAGP